MGLSPEMMKALERINFTKPTDVQSKAILPMLEKQDLLVQAPTGTGKTAAFGIPIIENIEPKARAIQCVIVCPTRELAVQTERVLRDLTTYKQGIRTLALYGGEPMQKQFAGLRRKPQIIVATPGRLLDHMQRRTVQLHHANTVVLDEADRMLDMGFRGDIDRILRSVNDTRQVALFSATLSPEIRNIAASYQKNPVEIAVAQTANSVVKIDQHSIEVPQKQKTTALLNLLKQESFTSPLIFVSTKAMARSLSRQLSSYGYNADSLHGDMRQNQRNRVMASFRNGRIHTLVATDVAARGIDVSDIDAVINYDIPNDSDSYTHRIGRTGRAQRTGVAYTIIAPHQRRELQNIRRETQSTITSVTVPMETFKRKTSNRPNNQQQAKGNRNYKGKKRNYRGKQRNNKRQNAY